MNLLLSFSAGVALSMDCLAVASCYGIQAPKNRRLMLELGMWFGLFQFAMILTGSLLGSTVVKLIYQYAKILSSLLLGAIAVKMFIEGIKGEENCFETDRRRIIYLAFATSVDALLLGFAYSMLRENIFLTAVIVGVVCFIFTVGGFIVGSILHRFVDRFAQFLGAAILLLIAVKAFFTE
ncbi:MAG: manganese efflux pump MntP family protein [Deltaproteobacteria bacterium]|nr:manganese efflux pump MntP family protein [Deltaproteobacteria bacterium]